MAGRSFVKACSHEIVRSPRPPPQTALPTPTPPPAGASRGGAAGDGTPDEGGVRAGRWAAAVPWPRPRSRPGGGRAGRQSRRPWGGESEAQREAGGRPLTGGRERGRGSRLSRAGEASETDGGGPIAADARADAGDAARNRGHRDGRRGPQCGRGPADRVGGGAAQARAAPLPCSRRSGGFAGNPRGFRIWCTALLGGPSAVAFCSSLSSAAAATLCYRSFFPLPTAGRC